MYRQELQEKFFIEIQFCLIGVFWHEKGFIVPVTGIMNRRAGKKKKSSAKNLCGIRSRTQKVILKKKGKGMKSKRWLCDVGG